MKASRDAYLQDDTFAHRAAQLAKAYDVESRADFDVTLIVLLSNALGMELVDSPLQARWQGLILRLVFGKKNPSSQTLAKRLFYGNFRRTFLAEALHQYESVRLEHLLRKFPRDSLLLLNESELPSYFNQLERRTLFRYKDAFAHFSKAEKSSFLLSIFHQQRTAWVVSSLLKNAPILLLWLGLISAFWLALFVWGQGAANVSLWDTLVKWWNFLLRIR